MKNSLQPWLSMQSCGLLHSRVFIFTLWSIFAEITLINAVFAVPFMLHLKKIFALLFIAAFLSFIPLAFAESKSDVVQVTFVLKDDNSYAKPGGTPGGSKPSVDYKIWFKGYKTDTTVPLVVYTANPEGLSSSFVTAAIEASINTWDSETSATLVNTLTSVDGYGVLGKDDQNSIMFGSYSDNRAIAVTYAWINRATRQLVEYDILFNTYFTWGDAAVNSALMDLQNIATHELGHGFNLADIYDQSKSALTMYGYSGEGDTAKRTLEPGDITGLRVVFGP